MPTKEIFKDDSDDEFFRLLKEDCSPRKDSLNWNDLFSNGSMVILLKDVEDPFNDGILKKDTVLIVRKVIKLKHTILVTCEDPAKKLWNVRPGILKQIPMPTEKKGRFKILHMKGLL